MPHTCTNCGRRFSDGSKEMLSGCPDCGGNKFQFQPKGRSADSSSDPDPSSDSDPAPDATPEAPSTAGTGASASTTADPLSRSWPSGDDGEDDDADIIEPDPEPPPDSLGAPDRTRTDAGSEDHAQSDARTEVATDDEVADSADPAASDSDAPGASPQDPTDDDATVAATPDDDQPDLADLRRELNDQFESIRVLNPGQYELNLMELYDREEYIISLREDGRYVIEVPETWRGSDPE